MRRRALLAVAALLAGWTGGGDAQAPRTMRRLGDGVIAVPAPQPAWQLRKVPVNAVTVASSTTSVQRYEDLGQVAQRTGSGPGAIAHANRIAPPYRLVPGRRLTIPGGRYHQVQAGDSGIAISRTYGVAWSEIVAANDLAEPYVLSPGLRILIPGATGATNRRSLDERAAAFHIDIDDIITGGEPASAPDPAPGSDRSSVLAPYQPLTPPATLSGGFAWPVRGQVVSRFGRGASGERNNGIKIAVPLGTPVKAVADGVVAYAGNEVAGMGGLVIVKHGDNWTSVYGHLSQLLVRRGQQVTRGQTVALSGDSGYADRPELHFELRRKRTPVNPQGELPRS